MCRIPPSLPGVFNFTRGGARRSPRCTYPLILALEGNILYDCSITFPWSSALPWVPRVWLAPWSGPLWVRFAGGEGQVEGQIRAGRRPCLCRRRVAGVRVAWPLPGGCGRKSLGFCSCLTPRAAKASLYSLGVRSTCRAGRRLFLPVCPTDRRWWSVLRGPTLSGCTRGSSWARLARQGSSRLMADSAAVDVASIAGSSGRRR